MKDRTVATKTAENEGTPPQARTGNPDKRLTGPLVLLLATATGMTVASIYYAQPLLEEIRHSLGLSVAAAGMIVTASQLGYAIGLVLLVPLGDIFERRNLVAVMTLILAVGLACVGLSANGWTMLLLSGSVGALSVIAQVLVAFSADLAEATQRGRVVGTVMSGLLLGVLSARTIAGLVAQILGWRSVFWLAAGVMTLIAFAMYKGLPLRTPNVQSGYRTLLASIPAIFLEERLLRLRSFYGAIAFAIFSALWTPLAFFLSQQPFAYEPGTIGLFGLAGIAGAMAASVAGRLSDKGASRRTTMAAILLLIASWLPIWLGSHSVLLLLAGIIGADFGVQALHITNQSEIYRLRPEARSRLTSVYMTCFFLGGVCGSSLSALAYGAYGWTGVCMLGLLLGTTALAVNLLFDRRSNRMS